MAASYETSTHAQHWILNPEDIRKKREVANELARTNMSNQYAGFNQDCVISIDEGLELVKKLVLMIIKICQKEKYIPRVLWTAAIMFRRFYLNNSLINNENDPTLMMLTSIFVAGKAEEAPYTSALRGINVGALCAKTNSKFAVKDIIKAEINFLEGIQFHLVVFNPTRPLKGYIQVLKGDQNGPGWEEYGKICDEVILFSILSDCCLMFPPSQIALAVLLFACERMEIPPVTKDTILNEFIFKSLEKGSEKANKILQVFESISKELEYGSRDPEKKLYRAANKKLKKIQELVEMAEITRLNQENMKKIKREPVSVMKQETPPPLPKVKRESLK
uniref:Cyclin-like domain-containing protein n=2 Tax=Aplanochytrium stocchinoi TaxID=215587 RepID=A0A7S3LNN9_9STRA|mmetsp:Transcript_18955/g.23237  ORF Transcript_18955/g.23237 Transcript_18955/m.23237 type:complete len:334 (-) Transcript_18955:553-1554(-)|eukprot:CAMPEP_0204826278 /NCGR_PEP_ID=MMETSP1346-20131115/4004_1 /ASSEMBLY_ACC=CAM_ASM_000771 /TAXON_ID=215587 /ORGANISM="Aplanochytrium stocchinoi, Strain GSBS06" /LENGTH=333 /DNA_ID=CAMNT_0051954237 /DNA_START=154 /DNA_END=1155 /DNA_ORIENTATION=-